MKSLFFSITFMFILSLGFSQDCLQSDYLKKGTKWEMSNYDKKGKFTGLTKNEVVDATHSDNKSTWSLKVAVFDKKNKLVTESTSTLICENGVYKIDMSNMMPSETMSSMQSMELEMDASTLDYPASLSTDTQLKDGSITIKASSSGILIMTMKLTISNRKVVDKETVETEAGTFECLKITQNNKLENRMVNREYSTTSWFLPGFGVIKTESYDHKGKLMSYSELSSLTK